MQIHEVDEPALAALLANPTADVLVVDLFATWCDACVKELPRLEAEVLGRPGVSLLLVSLDDARGARQALTRLATEAGLQAPIANFVGANAAAAMVRLVPAWPERIPVTLVLEPGGRERARFVGAVPEGALGGALTVRDPPAVTP